VAGHVRLELRNVVANYRFEKPHRFPEIQPNSGHGDHSRLSCDGGDTQLGPRVNFTQMLVSADMAGLAAILRRDFL
jgi:hypothetical protein